MEDSPPIGGTVAEAPGDGARNSSINTGDGGTQGGASEGGWSFARVTAMNGHFPSLKPAEPSATISTSGGGPNAGDGKAAGAWGLAASSATEASEAGSAAAATPAAGVGAWGTRIVASDGGGTPRIGRAAQGRAAPGGLESLALAEGEGGGVSSGKKKGRKGKAVSLFSNAGVRGGR